MGDPICQRAFRSLVKIDPFGMQPVRTPARGRVIQGRFEVIEAQEPLIAAIHTIQVLLFPCDPEGLLIKEDHGHYVDALLIELSRYLSPFTPSLVTNGS